MMGKTNSVPLSALTADATAVESDILLGKTAYVDGEKKTGTSTLNADTTDATLTANDMLYGVKGYGPDGTKLTGAGAYWQYVKSLVSTFNGAGLSGDIVFYAPLVRSFGEVFVNNYAMTSFSLITNSTLTNISYMVMNNYNLLSVTLNNTLESSCNCRSAFSGCKALTTINGALSLISANVLTMFSGCSSLQTVTFVPSSITGNLSLSSSPLLSIASLLSIANGLDGTAVGMTLTMHATAKTNMDAIMVDNNAGVAELGSAMTLTQFINDIKGWTIA